MVSDELQSSLLRPFAHVVTGQLARDREAAGVRQIHGRRGEVWLPESGTEHISVLRTG